MNIKKILVVLLGLLFLTGCTNIDDLSFDNIVSGIGKNIKNANVYRNGYKFYLPKGLNILDASFNYAIISSKNCNYYVYFDLVAFNENKKIAHESNPNAFYFQKFLYNNLDGYVEINLQKNNQYLIEIIYNYAKIEVMVDEAEIKKALINSINILNSIKYDAVIIENKLKDDNLNYTEETFDMFKKRKANTNILNYSDNNEENINNDNEIKDTDFLN